MFRQLYTSEPVFSAGVRLPAVGDTEQPIQKVEFALLLGMGVAAAAIASFLETGLRIPGNAIIRTIFPLALGIALVPRRGSGSTMGLAASVTALGFTSARLGTAGFGAMTSLLLCGVVLDAVITWAKSGWRLYVGLALAGLTVNMAAFAVKAGSKLAGVGGGMGGGGHGGGGGGGWNAWFPRAVISYPICGLIAGLLCAVILFRFRRRGDQQ